MHRPTLCPVQRGLRRLDFRAPEAQTITGAMPWRMGAAGYATVADHGPHHRANPFPYPTHPNPTPYQIFHLPMHATKEEIKSRYYELVRAHHPDSAYTSHLPAEQAHANFRHIKASYDYLSGKTLSPNPNAANHHTWQADSSFDPYAYELARRRRAYYASRSRAQRAEAERPAWAKGWGGLGAHPEERSDYDQSGWRERTIFIFGAITLMAGLFPTLPGTLATVFLPSSIFNPDIFTPSVNNSKQAPNPEASNTNNPSGNPPGPAPTPRFAIPFMDLDHGHRAAVSALIQAREEAKETAAERRDKIKLRVAQMGLDRDQGRDVVPGANGREVGPPTVAAIAAPPASPAILNEPSPDSTATTTHRTRPSPNPDSTTRSTPPPSPPL